MKYAGYGNYKENEAMEKEGEENAINLRKKNKQRNLRRLAASR